jgi:hypothetical protein
MSKIFITYRREDSAATCGRIYDRLVGRFGIMNVFKDVDSIPIGVNFKGRISELIAQCGVQLVVIGRQWLEVTNAQGQRRLDDPDDFVRLEIETGLQRKIVVIPVLVQGATVPRNCLRACDRCWRVMVCKCEMTPTSMGTCGGSSAP